MEACNVLKSVDSGVMNMMHCYPLNEVGSEILRQYFSVTAPCYHNAFARRGRFYLRDLRFNFLRKHVAGKKNVSLVSAFNFLATRTSHYAVPCFARFFISHPPTKYYYT